MMNSDINGERLDSRVARGQAWFAGRSVRRQLRWRARTVSVLGTDGAVPSIAAICKVPPAKCAENPLFAFRPMSRSLHSSLGDGLLRGERETVQIFPKTPRQSRNLRLARGGVRLSVRALQNVQNSWRPSGGLLRENVQTFPKSFDKLRTFGSGEGVRLSVRALQNVKNSRRSCTESARETVQTFPKVATS